ncbi:MAG TPA: hypothetical protein VHG32_17820 [Thermoanaerobaculia bacterium]|jgi:hypothetical protein|nr:hypothetical protein [Thermoanaerobaculia bacterium]
MLTLRATCRPPACPRRALRLLVVLLVAADAWAALGMAATSTRPLTVRQVKFLDRVLAMTVDPRGCTRIRYAAKAHDSFGRTTDVTAEAWLRPAAAGRPAVLLDVDGEDPRIPERYEMVSFVEQSRRLVAEDVLYDETTFPVLGAPIRAAWLHRLGKDALAAAFLNPHRRFDAEELEWLRDALAWSDYSRGLDAYIVSDDAEAALFFGRFAQRYADRDSRYGTPAHEIAAEVRRREPRRGQPVASAPPPGFADWPAERRVAWLIDRLDEVGSRQEGSPGGVSFGEEWRVSALIAEGEPAVEALIDCIARDRRLTRSVHFWRDFVENRTVLAVREPALAAVSSILRISPFEAYSTGDNFTREGEASASKTAAYLREYWREYRALAPDERMMKLLQDPKSTPKEARQAASNLATLGAHEVRGTTVWSDRPGAADEEAKRRAIAKYADPTIAEAMLAAMDRELAGIAASHDAEIMRTAGRHGAFSDWMKLIAALDDRRIAPAIAVRFVKERDAEAQRALVRAAAQLGDSSPVDTWANAVAAGELPLPEWDSWAGGEVGNALRLLRANPSPATRAARRALAIPSHPWYAAIREGFLGPLTSPEPDAMDEWLMMKVLRPLLDDTSPAGVTYQIEDQYLHVEGNQWSTAGPIPPVIANPRVRCGRVEARLSDQAALRLAERVHGMPGFHPLLVDADLPLAALRREVDRRLGEAAAEMGDR